MRCGFCFSIGCTGGKNRSETNELFGSTLCPVGRLGVMRAMNLRIAHCALPAVQSLCRGCRCEMEIEVQPTPSRLLRISTEMLPERERFSAFREEFARRVLMMDVIDLSDGRPRIDVTFMPLGEVAVGTLAATPVEFIRDKHHLKDRSDGFIFQFIESGPIRFAHVSEERTYDAGSAHFVTKNGR